MARAVHTRYAHGRVAAAECSGHVRGEGTWGVASSAAGNKGRLMCDPESELL